MKKSILITLLFLKTQISLAQLAHPALKIFLIDAETGKNITKAKVCLEGFNVKSIKADFNDQGNYYYFNEIPKGYNTVMAYHKGYNEKGYQNPGGLPKELHLKLYTPYRIRIAGDSLNYYKEDKAKIIVRFAQKFEDSIMKVAELDTVSIKSYFRKHYPELNLRFKKQYEIGLNRFCYVTKNTKKGFDRFNDPSIKKLSEDKNIHSINGLLLKTEVNYPGYKIHKTYFDKNGKPNYIHKYTQQFQDGRLIRNHALKKSELDSLYRIEEKKYKANEFYEYESTSDTLVQSFNNAPYMPTAEFHSIPYSMISNIMAKESKEQKKDSNVLFSFTYNIVTPEEEKRNFGSDYNLEKINEYPIRYRTKHLICSPFGLADVLEATTDSTNTFIQEVIATINRN